MIPLKLKLICGYRKDQQYTIDAEEAHKAYHLFLNPHERGIFENGLAITGQQIQAIEPDYNAIMGWNADHILDGDDYNELHARGIDTAVRGLMYDAKTIAQQRPDLLEKPLSKAMMMLPNRPKEITAGAVELANKLTLK